MAQHRVEVDERQRRVEVAERALVARVRGRPRSRGVQRRVDQLVGAGRSARAGPCGSTRRQSAPQGAIASACSGFIAACLTL